jgi:hypothetical protein
MNNEQINIAIACVCGHLNVRVSESGTIIASSGVTKEGGYYGTHGVPNYCKDLNAMHEAEKILSEDQRSSYRFYLCEILDVQTGIDGWRVINSTAMQRAEAFMRAIGKWEE